MNTLPLDQTRIGIFRLLGVIPALRDGVPQTDRTGRPLMVVQVLHLAPAREDGRLPKPAVEEIKVPADGVTDLPPMTDVSFVDLVARHWEMRSANGTSSGVSLSAAGFGAVTTRARGDQ